MTYDKILERIYALGRFGMRPGLERITLLLDRLGNPQDAFPVVHVAGTNGKGSTSAFLASILQSGGLRVGLFTSPHLSGFTERIRTDFSEISKEEVVDLAEEIFDAAPPGTTFFEIVTAMGFLAFRRSGAEIAVVEAGMGGRHDATNAARGLLSVITPIALDHCDYLGDNLAEIALEKAGIITPGRPVVISSQPQEAGMVLERAAESGGSRIFRWGTEFSAEWTEDEITYHGLRVFGRAVPGIAGDYQLVNA
ncbi:MAG TPA: Mur ligase family protein, partial [Verrucomicrobiae bacterium]|nr:Mur ligase family protein [Verrucomicrobiae bacterium]